MFKCSMLIACCTILLCAEIFIAHVIPRYNFSISTLYNETGLWYGEKIQLDHEGENLWDVTVNYTSDNLKNSQSILLVNNISPISQLKNSPDNIKFPPAPGYELITEQGYYKIHSELKTWDDALKICEQEGAHLYIFNSKMEVDAVDALIVKSSTGRTSYWIGVHDKYKEGHYVTIFNETVQRADYFKWNVDSREDQDCGYTYCNKSGYNLDDNVCDSSLPFICEKEI